jgi:hypothetical protein
MNSTYALNSQPRITTWVCQGRVVTTDLPTLGTNPNTKQRGSATKEAKDLSNLHSLGRTVRVGRADHPQAQGGPSENATRTSTAPRITDRPCPNRGPYGRKRLSALTSQIVRQTLSNEKHWTKRIETHACKNTWRTRRPDLLAPHGPSACPRPTIRQAQEQQPELENERSTCPIRPWISETACALEERFRREVKRP